MSTPDQLVRLRCGQERLEAPDRFADTQPLGDDNQPLEVEASPQALVCCRRHGGGVVGDHDVARAGGPLQDLGVAGALEMNATDTDEVKTGGALAAPLGDVLVEIVVRGEASQGSRLLGLDVSRFGGTLRYASGNSRRICASIALASRSRASRYSSTSWRCSR